MPLGRKLRDKHKPIFCGNVPYSKSWQNNNYTYRIITTLELFTQQNYTLNGLIDLLYGLLTNKKQVHDGFVMLLIIQILLLRHN